MQGRMQVPVATLAPCDALPVQLLRTLADRGITHLTAVPTLWAALAASLRQQSVATDAPKLRVAVSSGEPLPPSLLADLQRLLPFGCRILNLYGSTEVAADCTAFDCTDWRPSTQQPQQQQPQQQLAAERVPVGQPITGTLIAVLAGDSSPTGEGSDGSPRPAGAWDVAPLGTVGEVAVAGAGLAAGYLCCSPDATAVQQRRFIRLPTQKLQQAAQAGGSVSAARDLAALFGGEPTTPLFLTGDLGRLDASGCLHLLGRRDHQVKVSGVRVDLAEVEAALGQHPTVATAAAKLWQLPAGPVLAAYVQLHSTGSGGSAAVQPSSSELQDWCAHRLPPAAVPRHVLLLPQLPRSAAGKVQRSQLAHPLEAQQAAGRAVAEFDTAEETAAAHEDGLAAQPGSQPSKRQRTRPAGALAAPPSELAVSRAFAAALSHSGFEATSNLFALGGNSLMAAQIAGAVAGGDVEAVFRHPTVRSLAAHLASGAAAATAAAASGDQAEQPAALAVTARVLELDDGAAAAAEQRQERQPGRLWLAWRARMLQCVDAPPVLAEACPPAGEQPGALALACSHGGDVCCFDASSGRQLWQALLPDQTDAGLVICDLTTHVAAGNGSDGAPQQQQQQQQQQRYVAVGTNGGTLVFLDAASGSVAGSIDCEGGIRAPPTCDPWCGLVWQPSHGRQLVVAAAPGLRVAHLPLPAAVSAGVAFDVERRIAYVCCLDGSLLAVTVQPEGLAALVAGSDCAHSSSSGGGAPALTVAWQRRRDAPLFAPAAVLDGSGSVVAAGVDGSVVCLDAISGSQLWRSSVAGAVFAVPLPLPPVTGRRVLLAGTQDGRLTALDCANGQQLSTTGLGAKITGVQLLPAGPKPCVHIVVTLACGVVVLLDAARLLGQGGSSPGDAAVDSSGDSVLDAVRLPGDTFAAVAVARSPGGSMRVVVGCRDDHLYCLGVLGSPS